MELLKCNEEYWRDEMSIPSSTSYESRQSHIAEVNDGALAATNMERGQYTTDATCSRKAATSTTTTQQQQQLTTIYIMVGTCLSATSSNQSLTTPQAQVISNSGHDDMIVRPYTPLPPTTTLTQLSHSTMQFSTTTVAVSQPVPLTKQSRSLK